MPMRLLFIACLFCVVLAGAGGRTALAAQNDKPELVFYNWTAYVAPGVIEHFEETRNVTVRQEYFQSSDERDEKLLRNAGKGFDVIMINGNDIVPYARRGWIMPLGVKKVPSLAEMEPRWLTAWPDVDKYAVPYLWGTLGVIYRFDLIGEDITSWKQFYEPKEAWRGKVMLVDIHRLGIGMALKALGYSINSEDPKAVDEAIALVERQKPFVQTYGYLKTDADSGIVSGETWIGQTWNGDALLLRKRNPAIRYAVPKEGGEIWMDYMTVSAFSEHPDLAVDFVNYLSQADNSAKAALALEFATPNKKAKELLPKEFLENRVIYPSPEVLDASETVKNVDPRIKKKMVEAWARIKR